VIIRNLRQAAERFGLVALDGEVLGSAYLVHCAGVPPPLVHVNRATSGNYAVVLARVPFIML
jgi:hypothetical protein